MISRTRLGLGAVLFLCTWMLVYVPWDLRAIWPSVVALASVIIFRRVLVALVLGAFAGAVLLANGNPGIAFTELFGRHLLPHFGSAWKTGALIFTLVLGGYAAVLERSGALNHWLERLSRQGSRRRMEGAAMAFGLVCFFDGLANSLMVGRLFQGFADRVGVPRVRLAYIVDTTSAAVACLAFVSTWIAFQLDQIRTGLELAGVSDFGDPYSLFFRSIPYNFYSWFALVLLAIVIWRQWNLGSMRTAVEAQPAPPPASPAELGEGEGTGAWRFFVPLAVLLGAVFGGIYLDGRAKLEGAIAAGSWWERVALSFAAADAAVVMVWASALAAIVAVACFPRGGKVTGLAVFEEGVMALFRPALILVGAWMLSSVLGDLGATTVMGNLLSGRLSLSFLPGVVFLVASATAFTTGTSWGTMGILMPLAIPLVFSLSPEAGEAARTLALSGVIGAVFSGAVFGDHCSPLSDTTLVSSIACGLEPLDHIRTQFPYALLAGAVAFFAGFLPLFLVPFPGALLLLGVAVLGGLGWISAQR